MMLIYDSKVYIACLGVQCDRNRTKSFATENWSLSSWQINFTCPRAHFILLLYCKTV